jgi:hypothetical protein
MYRASHRIFAIRVRTRRAKKAIKLFTRDGVAFTHGYYETAPIDNSDCAVRVLDEARPLGFVARKLDRFSRPMPVLMEPFR